MGAVWFIFILVPDKDSRMQHFAAIRAVSISTDKADNGDKKAHSTRPRVETSRTV
jgi:hypothetical protein